MSFKTTGYFAVAAALISIAIAQSPEWGQCGGIGYSGPTACASPFTCHAINDCKSNLPYLYLEPNSNSYWYLDYSQCY